jgi:hypothetical protein
MSVAKTIFQGNRFGTAWLIHERHVVTAAHCVGAVGSAVDIQFWNPATNSFDPVNAGEVVRLNVPLDAALIRLVVARPDIPCLPVTRKGAPNSQPNWSGMGFPAAGAALVGVFGLQGSVALMRTAIVRKVANVAAIQLTCVQGLNQFPAQQLVDADGIQIHILAGISGSAVVIGERSNRVVGLVRCSFAALGAGTIYATSLEDVWAEFAPELPGVTLHDWQRIAGSVRLAAAGVVSNLDRELVNATWKEDVVKDITVDIPWAEARTLVPAILRLALHQPGLLRLHVRNAAAWNERFRCFADTWIALETFNPQERNAPAVELAQANHDAGTDYASVSAVAEAIQAMCDSYVLDLLDERLGVMFAAQRPEDYTGYHIASDILQQMTVNWTAWRDQLRADRILLHHFLALILTHHGTHDCGLESSPGAGPLTFRECLFPAVVFSLAVAPFLPAAIAPKRPQPGNLGHEAVNGHACGIQAIKRRPLDSELRGHQWPTQMVLLQWLRDLPAVWQAATDTLVSGGRSRPTLSRPAPSALIITRDEEIRTAIATSVAAIRQVLQARSSAQTQRQQDYADSASLPP